MRRVLVSLLVCAMVVGLPALAGAGETKAPAEAKKGVSVGMLKCNEASGWGLVFGSSRDLKCVFTPAVKAQPSRFTGKINEVRRGHRLPAGRRDLLGRDLDV